MASESLVTREQITGSLTDGVTDLLLRQTTPWPSPCVSRLIRLGDGMVKYILCRNHIVFVFHQCVLIRFCVPQCTYHLGLSPFLQQPRFESSLRLCAERILPFSIAEFPVNSLLEKTNKAYKISKYVSWKIGLCVCVCMCVQTKAHDPSTKHLNNYCISVCQPWPQQQLCQCHVTGQLP